MRPVQKIVLHLTRFKNVITKESLISQMRFSTKSEKLLTSILFGLVSMGVLCFPVSASFDEHLNTGITSYRNGEYRQAVNEFGRVLLANPEQKTALRYFKKMMSDTTMRPGQRALLVRIFELFDYVKFLKVHIGEYGEGNVADACSVSSLNRMKSVEGAVDFDNCLVNLVDITKEQKKCYARRLKELKAWDVAVIKKVEVVAQQKPKSKVLDEKLTTIRDELESLRKTVKKSENKISSLNMEIATKSLEVFEKENLLAMQASDFSTLENELGDAKERLNLVQRIISEKNDRIQSLEDYIKGMKQESLSENEISQKEVDLLQAQFASIQEQVDEQKKLQAERIDALEKLIAEQEIAIINYDMAIVEQKNEIGGLKTNFENKSREVSSLKKVIDSKDDKLLELNGIIQIYKEKLSETTDLIRRKTASFEDLTDELRETRSQLNVSQKTARELHERIMTIESQFSRIRENNSDLKED